MFQFNFNFGRNSFHVDNFPQVSTLKSICIFILLRICYMLHPTFYYVLDNAKGVVSSTNHEGSHRLKLTRPLLPHNSQPNTRIFSGIILHSL